MSYRHVTRRKALWGLGLLALMLIISGILELALGPLPIPVHRILPGLWQYFHGQTTTATVVLGDIRLPRICVAGVVGAGLAVAGTALQAVFRNPMADPGVIGVSSGGALGAVLAMEWGTVGASAWLTPVAAFVSGLVTTFLIYRLATKGRQTHVYFLLLSGVAINAFCSAIISLVLSLSPLETMQQMLFWLMGGLDGSTWSHAGIISLIVVLISLVIFTFAPDLDLISMGEEQAHGVGVHLQRIKQLILVCTALMVGVSVSFTGVIGFVGLMVPHILRLVLGPSHRVLVPAAALGGATLLLVADLIARMVFLPVELNVGIVTSALGAPFFLYLLKRNTQAFLGR